MYKTFIAAILFSISVYAQTPVYFSQTLTQFTVPDGCSIDYDNEGLYIIRPDDGAVEITLQELSTDARTISERTLESVNDNFDDIQFDAQQNEVFNGIKVILDAAQCTDRKSGNKLFIMIAVYEISETMCIQLVAQFTSEPTEKEVDLVRSVAESIEFISNN